MALDLWERLGVGARRLRLAPGWMENRAYFARPRVRTPAALSQAAAHVDLDAALPRTLAWIERAAAAGSPGIANGYHVIRGWNPADVETTGYTIVTLLGAARALDRPGLREVALRAARWELAELRADGWAAPLQARHGRVPLVFDTGQVLHGLVHAWRETKEPAFEDAARRAARALAQAQAPDGAWRTNAYRGVPHAYYARVAFPLADAGLALRDNAALEAARRALAWTAGELDGDAFPRSAAFSPNEGALTHTLAYTAEGLVEAGLLLKESAFVDEGARIARRLAQERAKHGFLPGSFRAGWTPDASFVCLTGNAQTALVLYRLNAEGRGAQGDIDQADALLREALHVGADQLAPPAFAGGVPGSFPIDGAYLPRYLPLWASKFAVDALLARRRLA